MPTKTVSILRALLITVVLSVITFIDFNNRLEIGPADANGFTPFDHGVFGNLVKGLLAAALLYYLFSQFIKYTWLRIILTTIMAIGMFVGGMLLSFSLYYTF